MQEPLGGNWLTGKAKEIFREYYDAIAKDLSEKLCKSANCGDQDAGEEFITGDFIRIINGYAEKSFNEYREKLKDALNGLYVDIHAWKNSSVSENRIGADLGIVLSVHTESFMLDKTVLIQSKKGYIENGRVFYPELKKRGIPQAKKMLRITPASFFMLYNVSGIADLDFIGTSLKEHFFKTRKISSIRADKHFGDDIFYFIFQKRPELFPYLFTSDKFLEYLWERQKLSYPGILVLPASEIAFLHRVDSTLEALLPACMSFSDFMVEIFMPCIVGDTRKQILEKAGASQKFIKNTITRFTTQISVSRG